MDKSDLNGYALSKSTPTGVFKWLNKYDDGVSRGFEVNPDYLKEFGKFHNHYPLTPDKL